MIRLALLYLIAALLGLFIQATMIHSSFPAAPAPDLILVLVLILAITYRTVPGLIGAFLLGLLADVASGQFLGPNAAGALVAFGIVGVLASRVFADRIVAVVFIAFFCSLAKSITVITMFTVYLNDNLLGRDLIDIVLLEAAFSALVAPLVLKLMLAGKRSGSGSRTTGTGTFRWSHEMK